MKHTPNEGYIEIRACDPDGKERAKYYAPFVPPSGEDATLKVMAERREDGALRFDHEYIVKGPRREIRSI